MADVELDYVVVAVREAFVARGQVGSEIELAASADDNPTRHLTFKADDARFAVFHPGDNLRVRVDRVPAAS